MNFHNDHSDDDQDDDDQANYDHDDRRPVAWFLLPACQTLQHRLCPASAGGDHHRHCCHHIMI